MAFAENVFYESKNVVRTSQQRGDMMQRFWSKKDLFDQLNLFWNKSLNCFVVYAFQ